MFYVFIPFDRDPAERFGARRTVSANGLIETFQGKTADGKFVHGLVPTDKFSTWLLEFCPSWNSCWEQRNQARFGFPPTREGMVFQFKEAKCAVLCKLRWGGE
jgi:hypothetical protein